MLAKSILIGFLLLTVFNNAYSQGKFERQVIDDKVSIGYGIAIADVDGDGKQDILLADKKQFVWYRNGDWKRFIMAENLTEHDNVCIAAKDINNDGKAEVAVGAQWNPGETTDANQSGAVFYLVRPSDPTQLWTALKLHHEPTVHRMQWVKYSKNKYYLVVAPLHGRGNKSGEGAGAKLLAYYPPAHPNDKWRIDTLENTMHLTHNFFVKEESSGSTIYLAGKEGVKPIIITNGSKADGLIKINNMQKATGEIQSARDIDKELNFFATIEPMHGNNVVVYANNQSQRMLLDSSLKEGHAIAVADVLHTGIPQVIAGWRGADKDGKVGVKLYSSEIDREARWKTTWIDENGMACEDLKVADLDNDGKPDIIASGRASHNLVIYWNR